MAVGPGFERLVDSNDSALRHGYFLVVAVREATMNLLALRRALAAALDLLFVLSYVFSFGFTASALGVLSQEGVVLPTFAFAFPLLYYAVRRQLDLLADDN